MSKKKIIFIGDHPQGVSGNSHMMKAVLDQVDRSLYQVVCFSEIPVISSSDIFSTDKIPVITPSNDDQYGSRKLVEVIRANNFDAMIMVGIDLWHHFSVWNELLNLRTSRGFRWGAIFPYDLIEIRKDWVEYINNLDKPKVYSKYGFDLLKDAVPGIGYFRPPMLNHHLYKRFSDEERIGLKNKYFSGYDHGRFVFGFIGNNQVRKDPQRAIRAYFKAKAIEPNIVLYVHSDFRSGVFNLGQFIEDCGSEAGEVLIRNQEAYYSDEMMAEVYNSIDCLLNTSLQEGLSWTILQAQLCGVPVIGASNTAQVELLDGNKGLGVPCTELSFLSLVTSTGPAHVETYACNMDKLVDNISAIPNMDTSSMTKTAHEFAKDWAENPSDINEYIEELFSRSDLKIISVHAKEKVLFIQHSSAGDVFMTTRCFRGLKKRHPNIPLVYMTQSQYKNIIEGNPYIDEIVDWDLSKVKQYQYVYNPHGDRIAPGHWGRNCNSILSDFYWKILNVEPDDFFIKLTEPLFYHYADLEKKIKDYEYLFDQYVYFSNGDITKPILVVHTTGGNPHFRTYKYMKDVCRAMDDKYLTVQLGGASDYPAWAKIDLRGKLSFQETAWVMSKAKMAVTVDSFISHLAGAFGVSQVCLFGSGNYVVVQPLQVSGVLVNRSISYVAWCKGLGPCSGCVADCPVPCTSRHDPKDILNDLLFIEANFGKNIVESRISE